MIKKLLLSVSCLTALQGLEAQVNTVSIDIVTMIEDHDAESFRHELEMGLNPNACLDDLSLLMIAAQLGSVEIVQDLLACNDIDVQAQDNDGNTALHFAVTFGHPQVVKLIVYADAPVECSCEKRSHFRFAYLIKNRDGQSPADLAYSGELQEMLSNPDAYIKSHPQEFREVAHWFDITCPEKARARIRRLETWGERVSRTCKKAKDAVVGAVDTTADTAKQAYEKTKDVAAKGYQVGKKAKRRVDSKYDKAKAFIACRYKKVKDVAVNAYDATCEYASSGFGKTKDVASTGLEKTKEVAKSGYDKTKNAMQSAYQKAKAKLAS